MNNLILRLKDNYLLFILFWMAAVLIFAYAWVPGGLDTDSCNYAVVAKEIVRTNRWLKLYDPVYQGVFYYHFPLAIWITALFFKLFGITSFTAQLFSLLSGVILVGVIFYLGRLLKNNWVGFFGGVSFLFTNHIIRLARECRMDIPVSLFITLAIFSFILAQRHARLYYLLFGLFTCLAIFTKDVFGLFPLAIVFIYLIFRLKWKEFFHPLFILGLLLSIGPVFFWMWLDEQALFYGWFHWNFLHLLKSPEFIVPGYYYPWVITTKYFYFLPFALYGGYLAIKEAGKNKNYEFYLLMIWTLVFPIAFSFGKQKLHYFILPIYPAASLLVGIALDRIFKDTIKPRLVTGIKYTLIFATLIMLCFPLNIQSKRFIKTVKMAPMIDEVLKQIPEYEFFVYKQDTASLLFYSQQLTQVKRISDATSLEETLTLPGTKPRLCYMSEQDFTQLNPSLRESYQVILKYKDNILMINQKEPGPVVTLP